MSFLTTLNQRIALTLTRAVGTMWCAYAFVFLALVGFPGFSASPTQYVQWISQTLIQLVMLSVIMVGQQILSTTQDAHHAEVQDLHIQNLAAHQDHRDTADQIAAQMTVLQAQVAALASSPRAKKGTPA